MVSEGLGEGFESSGLTGSCLDFVLSEDGVVVGLAGGDEVVNDAGELVGGGGDGLWGPKAVAHATLGVAEARLATVKALGGHAQRGGGGVVDLSGPGREHLAAGDAIVGAEPEPTGEAAGCGKG